MEEIPKEMGKDNSRSGSTRVNKKTTRWTLLFIDDRGRTIAFKRFKGLATLAVILMLVSVGVAAGSYFLYDRSAREKRQMESALVASLQKTRTLINEKEKLAARMIILESRTDNPTGPDAVPEPVSKSVSPVVESDGVDPPDEAQADEAQADEAQAVAGAAVDPGPMKVAVEGLKVFRKTGRNRMEVKFTLKNTNDGPEPISGYSFVVLKDDGNDPSKWFIFPKVNMVSGKPAPIKGGRYFQISRFKTITFDTQEKVTPEKYRAATIMIYNKSGELMLEKDFSLKEES